MAKDVTQKFRIDATQATQAIKSVVTSLTKYNTEVKKVSESTKAQNKALTALNPKLKAFADNMKVVVRESAKLSRAYATQTAKVKEAARAAGSVSRSMGTLAKNVRAANSAMRAASASAQTFAARFKDAGINMAKANRNLRNAAALMGDFNIQIRKVIASMKVKDSGLAKQTALHQIHNRKMKDAARDAKSVVVSWQSIARIVATTAVHRIALRLAQAFLEARKEAQEFYIRIGEIKTIEGEVKLATQAWRQELVGLSNAYGFDVLSAAEGAYQALSNQVVEAGQTAGFMTEEMKLARTAVTTLGNAVGATTSVLNAWNLEQVKARSVNAILMATVERGRLRLEELANTLGRVNILSSQLGITVLEQNSAIALLTRQGVKAEEAITLLRNVMLKLIKPTDYMIETMKEWGVETGIAAIQAFGLPGVLERIRVAAKDGGEEMAELGKMFGRIRAIVGATGLRPEEFRAEIKEMIKASQDYENKVVEAFTNTGRQLQIQFQRVKNVLVDEFAIPFNDALLEVSKAAGGLDNAFRNMYTVLRRGVTLFISYRVSLLLVTQATTAHTLKMTLLQYAYIKTLRAVQAFKAASGVLAATLAIDYVLEGIRAYGALGEEVRAAGANARAASQEFGNMQFDKWAASTRGAFEVFNATVTWTFQQYYAYVAGVRKENFALEENFKKTFKAIGESIKLSLKAPLADLKEEIADLAKRAEEIRKDIDSRKSDIAGRKLDSKEDKFRSSLIGKSETEQLKELNRLKIQLNRDALAAMAADNVEEADRLFRKVESLQTEITNRLRTLHGEAIKIEDVKVDVRRRVFDPLTGRNRTITRKVKVGERTRDPDAAAAALAELNRLEAERTKIVKDRIAAEEAFIRRKEAEATRLEAEAKFREGALVAFKNTLAALDAFDITQKDAGKKYDVLIKRADAESRAAGLDPADRIAFLREAHKQRLTLAKDLHRRIASDDLDIVKATLDRTEELFQNAAKEREAALTSRTQIGVKEVIPAVQDIVGQLTTFQERLQINMRQRSDLPRYRAYKEAEASLVRLKNASKEFQSTQTDASFLAFAEALQTVRTQLIELDKHRGKFEEWANGRLWTQQARQLSDSLLVDPDNATNVKQLSAQLEFLYKKLVAANTRVNKGRALEGDLDARLAMIQDRLNTIPTEYRKTATSAKDAAVAQILAAKNTVQALELIEQRLKRIRLHHEALRRMGAVIGGPGIAMGGAMTPARHFGMGGAQGIDRYPAFLAEGEVVMTQMASSQFAPLLHAMNAMGPAARQGQGSVTFGDTHITVPQGSTDVQIDAIISGLQRRSRQGLLKL